MEVQINLDRPFLYTTGDPVPEFKFTGDLILAVDPGKRNMALTIGNPQGNVLAIVQFRAPGRDNDNSEYCQDVKTFISTFLHGRHIKVFGIEQAISKKGMNYHHSSMVLTEIRANLIDLAFQLTGRKAFEINNWSWKYAILPDGLRSQSEKGSAKFLAKTFEQYGNADVTDSICMYRYVLQKCYQVAPIIIPSDVEQPIVPFEIRIIPAGTYAAQQPQQFYYDQTYSLEENAVYYANRTYQLGVCKVPVSKLSLEQIYKYATNFIPLNSGAEFVEAAVFRTNS